MLVEVLVEPKSRREVGEQAGERRLAHCERIAPQVITVKLDQVERIEEHARVVPPIPDAVERRDPVVAAVVRQVLGAIAQFEKTSLVAKLKAAHDRKKGAAGPIVKLGQTSLRLPSNCRPRACHYARYPPRLRPKGI